MKQNILPFKIGMQYENWEFSLEPIHEDRFEGFDSFLYLEELICNFTLLEYLELLFNLDILKVVVYVLSLETEEKHRQLRNVLEESFGHKYFFKSYNSTIESLKISGNIEIWIVQKPIHLRVEVSYGSFKDLKKIYSKLI